MLSLLTGVVAGAVHVLAGPDHLAVLAPFSVEAGRGAWRVGLRWGIGHTAGLVGVAALAWLLRGALDLSLLQRASAPLIGVVLIGVGVWGLVHASRAHVGVHAPGEAHVHTTAALLFGTLHGIAGTGGVLAVIPVLAMPTALGAGVYLLGFSAGTLASMVAFAMLLGRLSPRTHGSAYRRVFVAASTAAVVVGAAWLVLAWLGVDLHAHAA